MIGVEIGSGSRSAFTLNTPGDRPRHADRDQAFDLGWLVDLLKDCFFEAAAALVLYQQDKRNRDSLYGPREQSEASRTAMGTILVALSQQSDLLPAGARLLLHERVTDDMIQRGEIPTEICRRYTALHAKGFVYALANLGKLLAKLEPTTIGDAAAAAYWSAFPDLIGIRDSTQHPENRSLGQDRKGNPLNLNPPNLLAIDNFQNDHFTTALEGGAQGSVEISEASLRKARDILEGALIQLDWEQHPWLGNGMAPQVVDWSLLESLAVQAALGKQEQQD